MGEENMELKFVFGVFRHGDRSPATTLPPALHGSSLALTQEEEKYFKGRMISPGLQRLWLRHFPVRFIPKMSQKERDFRYSPIENEMKNIPFLPPSTSVFIPPARSFPPSFFSSSPFLPSCPVRPSHVYDREDSGKNSKFAAQILGSLQDLDPTEVKEGDNSKASTIYGKLTDHGAWQLQERGVELRHRYTQEIPFLPLPTSQDEKPSIPLQKLIFARSTAFARTIQSTQNMLIGLLSPDSKTNFWKQSPEKKLEGYWGHEEGGGGQECVVPIHVRDPKDDTACPSGRYCEPLTKRWVKGEKELSESDRTKETYTGAYPRLPFAASLNQLLQEIFKVKHGANLFPIHDWLRCRKSHSLWVPDGVTPILLDQIVREVCWRLMKYYSTGNTTQIVTGRLVAEIFDEMRAHVIHDMKENGQTVENIEEGKGPHHLKHQGGFPKLMLVGGHDTTLIPLLYAYQMYDGLWPLYGSTLLIELWKEKPSSSSPSSPSPYWVRFIFNGKPLLPRGRGEGEGDGEAVKRKGEFVGWNEFARLSMSCISSDFEETCGCGCE